MTLNLPKEQPFSFQMFSWSLCLLWCFFICYLMQCYVMGKQFAILHCSFRSRCLAQRLNITWVNHSLYRQAWLQVSALPPIPVCCCSGPPWRSREWLQYLCSCLSSGIQPGQSHIASIWRVYPWMRTLCSLPWPSLSQSLSPPLYLLDKQIGK